MGLTRAPGAATFKSPRLRRPRRSVIMTIYGTALLSICLLLGLALGKGLGALVGIEADIGGIGIAMLLLIASCGYLQRTGRLKPPTEAGIAFWSSVYIPIVVAMAASQNVVQAVSGGLVALLAGALSVAVCYSLVGVLTRLGGSHANQEELAVDDPASSR